MLINGQPGDIVSIQDRGLSYGDGIFETILCEGGKPILLAGHIQRLINGCERLKISPQDRATVLSEIREVAQQDDCLVKIIVTRGARPRGYAYNQNDSSTTRIISKSPILNIPTEYYTHGVSIRTCEYRLPQNPYLAEIKHLNRLDQVIARSEWGSEFQEGLMLDSEGYVVEGTMTNVFIEKDQQWMTPKLDRAGVKGVMRQWIMRNSHYANIECTEKNIELPEVENADAIFICNSVVGIWPVNALDNRQFELSDSVKCIMKVAHNKLSHLYHGDGNV